MFARWPYTDLENLNLDWLIAVCKEITTTWPPKLEEIEKEVNNKLDKALNEGTLGDILTNNGNGTYTWKSFDDSIGTLVVGAVNNWLNNHPEATTTVQDGVISYQKLNTILKNRLDSNSFISSLNLPTIPFITMANPNYTAQQGMCVIDNQYIVSCRYYGSNQRAFRVYDAINKSFISESLLLDTEVGHVNSLCYRLS